MSVFKALPTFCTSSKIISNLFYIDIYNISNQSIILLNNGLSIFLRTKGTTGIKLNALFIIQIRITCDYLSSKCGLIEVLLQKE